MEDSTKQMTVKETAFAKAISIISGCRTREQLDNARAYIRRYTNSYGDGTECATLWDIVRKVDESLFPLSQRPL